MSMKTFLYGGGSPHVYRGGSESYISFADIDIQAVAGDFPAVTYDGPSRVLRFVLPFGGGDGAYNDAPLTSRVAAVESSLAAIPAPYDPTPLAGRVSAVETAVSGLVIPPAYNDAPISARISALEGQPPHPPALIGLRVVNGQLFADMSDGSSLQVALPQSSSSPEPEPEPTSSATLTAGEQQSVGASGDPAVTSIS